MSASLVGSEMCIRDRHRSLQECPEIARQGTYSSCREKLADRTEPDVYWSCLLYTSDAADDM
eukprot:4154399-Alexandrium_andersonii.AAC.1